MQEQTFKYFWDFGHPASGLARERNTSGDVTTSGGSGFGIMAIPVGINRSFITRNEGLQRMQTIVAFLKNTAQTFHGAYPHWINGNTGAAVPFSPNDNGADLVETSYLVMGLLCARQYFDAANTNEITLRDDINIIVNRVEWDWFRRGGQNVLYWHWSPTV
ncbi:MAG TPA: beta-glucosidase, partial [Ferruginibacter sp.]|nr:beta-glucosidase [Ferruginibacter sp.]